MQPFLFKIIMSRTVVLIASSLRRTLVPQKSIEQTSKLTARSKIFLKSELQINHAA
jgi:hypothetical protein